MELCVSGLVRMDLILTNDDESHAIEPRSYIGQHPQQNSELNRIDEIFNKEHSPQLHHSCVNVSHSHIDYFSDLVLGKRYVQFEEIFEGMTVASFLHGLNNVLVNSESYCAGKGDEGEISYDADQGEVGEGQ